ncbi:MAG TPA: hypothetical protein VF518_09425, partial [Polyangia bacterium]
HAGRIALKLRLSSSQAEGVMVSASRPGNVGVTVGRKFCRIGLLPLTELVLTHKSGCWIPYD